MNRQTLRVPLICFSALVLFLDLSLIIQTLNMGKQDLSGLVTAGYVLANLLLAAGWAVYFFGIPKFRR